MPVRLIVLTLVNYERQLLDVQPAYLFVKFVVSYKQYIAERKGAHLRLVRFRLVQ